MASGPRRLQSNVKGAEGESVIFEDPEHLFVLDVTHSPLTRAAAEMMRKEMGADDWEQVTPDLRRAKKGRP